MESVKEFVEPLKKRWIYHFIISPKTNRAEKPEWYLNKTLAWIHQYIDIVETKVKIPSNNQQAKQNVRHEFIMCMLEFCCTRLSKDMNSIKNSVGEDSRSDAILIHTYNEVIQFVKIIRQLLGERYDTLDEKYDVLSIMTEQSLFEKIVDIEWECAEMNLREIFEAENKWDLVLGVDFIDIYKIPRCVDRFLLLQKSISERVECFRYEDCQLKLIELQCHLFKLFLKSLKKRMENKGSYMFFFIDNEPAANISGIYNGIKFIRLILKEHAFIPNAMKDKTFFDQVAKDYEETFNKLADKMSSESP